jgi:PAS domain S-box-containing protein
MVPDYERILLRELAPPCVVVDGDGAALHFSGPVERYLELQGPPTRDVIGLAREEVRVELRTALRRALRERATVTERCGRRRDGEADLATEVVVRPLPSTGGGAARWLVAFRELILEPARAPDEGAPGLEDQLRAELAVTRARLRAAVAEAETSGAEERAANERLRALNDELRSSQEALEALNEELSAAEAASRASKARLEQIVDSVPHLVWTATPDGIRDYFSQQWREYTGLSAGPQLDGVWTEAYHPEDRPAMLAAWREAVRTGAPFQAEYRIRRHDGVYRWFKGRANPLRGAGGAVERWIGTSTDIDDVKRLEASLRDGSRRKDEFMALLAHELRNPLAPLGNSLDILRRHADRQHVARATEVIDRQVTHLTRLVDDLLDVSRITRGKIRIRRERVDLGALVATLLDDHRPIFAAAGLRLEGALAARPVWVEGDAARLAQMLENLLQNARKFTDRGGSVTVAVELAPDGRAVAVRVRDDGIGMDPAAVEGMFEAFAQGDATLAHSRGGLGLGLTLVRTLAELHGGSVSGASEGPGRGSEFVLRLPLAAPPAEVAPAPGAAPVARRRVLVVDDNQDAADMFAELLRLEGHEVRIAGDGRAALEEARRFQPEVAFCDIGLPGGLDGYALARALRAEPGLEHVLLVAMTGYATDDDRRRSRDAGFDVHLAKPARIEALNGALALWTPGGARHGPPPGEDRAAAG